MTDKKRLALKKPCSDCPFRRKAIPGWLGADTPEGFIHKTEAGVQMPCHQTVDYETPDWEEAAKAAPLCAGSLIYLNNNCKSVYAMPGSPAWLAEGIPLVKQGVANIAGDRKAVFAFKHEFIAHHSQGSLAAHFERKARRESS